MDYIVHGVEKSQTRLSSFHFLTAMAVYQLLSFTFSCGVASGRSMLTTVRHLKWLAAMHVSSKLEMTQMFINRRMN